MIVVLSGTNRPGCNTLKVAEQVRDMLAAVGNETELLNLQDLPPDLFDPASYGQKPDAFAPFQKAVLEADGVLTVLPEYNGSFPGILKYFIDMLKFPESLAGIPAGFVGLAAGEWGGLRAVEQIELVFQYRSAHLYGRRVFLKHIHTLLDDAGRLTEPKLVERLEKMVHGFASFCREVRTAG